MVQPITVGLDIAKNVFHAYGVDAQGEKVLKRLARPGEDLPVLGRRPHRHLPLTKAMQLSGVAYA